MPGEPEAREEKNVTEAQSGAGTVSDLSPNLIRVLEQGDDISPPYFGQTNGKAEDPSAGCA